MGSFIIPFIIAVLSGMGFGGGGLLVIYLALFENAEQMVAQGANLALFISSAAASTLFNAAKKKIKWRLILPMIAAGIPASALGAFIAGAIDPSLLRKIFGAMLVITGCVSLFSRKK